MSILMYYPPMLKQEYSLKFDKITIRSTYDMSTRNAPYCVILTACLSVEEAEKIARNLIESRAAACVQMTGIASFYTWKGKTEKSDEILLLIKTRSSLFGKVESIIRTLHSYEVPEIVVLPIMRGFKKYIDWIDEATEER